jgi:hypothetical protein
MATIYFSEKVAFKWFGQPYFLLLLQATVAKIIQTKATMGAILRIEEYFFIIVNV